MKIDYKRVNKNENEKSDFSTNYEHFVNKNILVRKLFPVPKKN
jgi:hypothetical protein